jgi:hypothetical protein
VLEVSGVRFDSEISRLDGQRAEQALVHPARLPSIGKSWRSAATTPKGAPSALSSEGLGITVRPPSRPR